MVVYCNLTGLWPKPLHSAKRRDANEYARPQIRGSAHRLKKIYWHFLDIILTSKPLVFEKSCKNVSTEEVKIKAL